MECSDGGWLVETAARMALGGGGVEGRAVGVCCCGGGEERGRPGLPLWPMAGTFSIDSSDEDPAINIPYRYVYNGKNFGLKTAKIRYRSYLGSVGAQGRQKHDLLG